MFVHVVYNVGAISRRQKESIFAVYRTDTFYLYSLTLSRTVIRTRQDHIDTKKRAIEIAVNCHFTFSNGHDSQHANSADSHRFCV